MTEPIDLTRPYFLDADPVTTDWPMPTPLPLFESESANDAVQRTWWQRVWTRVCGFFAAIDEPFTLSELDRD